MAFNCTFTCLFVFCSNFFYAENWTLPDQALGFRVSPILLLSRSDVQAELDLDSAILPEVRRVISELQSAAAATQRLTGPDVISRRRAIDQRAAEWINAHLNEAQRVRLAQIDLQWEGVSAVLSRPLLVETLDLSNDQRTQLETKLRQNWANPVEGILERRNANTQALSSILNEDQRLQWQSIVGPEYNPQIIDSPVSSDSTASNAEPG